MKPNTEGSFTMLVPLLILAFFAAFSGFIPFNELVTSDGALHFNSDSMRSFQFFLYSCL